ncbi:hypothetical protein [Rhodovastum atsumiense]|uniref:Uncharacterized protein n=2 Tax=Rhodovastum atsumiense TaxID=504468 RepID=A0A5M6ITL6_9PROT|nr:hypothetical protein [Rhodovastum atsumiense]KAA5611660.1 hypothetical protein F1189_13955 [Rhodovastum atsumiense]
MDLTIAMRGVLLRRLNALHLAFTGVLDLRSMSVIVRALDEIMRNGDGHPAPLSEADLDIAAAFRAELVARIASAHENGEVIAELHGAGPRQPPSTPVAATPDAEVPPPPPVPAETPEVAPPSVAELTAPLPQAPSAGDAPSPSAAAPAGSAQPQAATLLGRLLGRHSAPDASPPKESDPPREGAPSKDGPIPLILWNN